MARSPNPAHLRGPPFKHDTSLDICCIVRHTGACVNKYIIIHLELHYYFSDHRFDYVIVWLRCVPTAVSDR